MWWKQWLLTIWAAWLVGGQERDGRALTWAQIMAAPPQPPQKAPTVLTQNLDSPFSPRKVSTDEFTDYDENFFHNSYYEYVDTEDPTYTRPEVPQQTEREHVNQEADRRTLDTIFHLFMGSQDPGRGVRTTPRPTLLQAVFNTIDEHLVQDIQDLMAYLNRGDEGTNSRPSTNRGPGSSVQSLAPIQSSQEADDLLLLRDEAGQQHTITINDIVTSLSHLDEETLTNLLLSPDQQGVASERSTKTILPPTDVHRTFHKEAPSSTLDIPGIKNDDVQRPVRHTGPLQDATTGSDDVYVVKDEHGDIQLVTLHDILASLSALDSSSVNELLFSEPDDIIDPLLGQLTPDFGSLPSQVSSLPQSSEATQVPIIADITTVTSTSAPTVPPTPTLTTMPAAEIDLNPTETNHNIIPITTTGINHNIINKGTAYNRPIVLDRPPKLSQNTAPSQKTKTQKIGGSLIHRDEQGNIHITPDRSKPFNVQDIVALAEQEQQTERPSHIYPNILQTRQKEQEARRSQQLLSFLANNGGSSLSTNQFNRQRAIGTNNLRKPPLVNTLQRPLLRTVRQPVVESQHPPSQIIRQPAVAPLVKSRVPQPVILPFLQSVKRAPVVVQPVTQAPTRGLTNTLSDWFSWLVGESSEEEEEEAKEVPPPPSPPPSPLAREPNYVQMVVQEQAPETPDTVLGHVRIPLPQPIHFQSSALPSILPQVVENPRSRSPTTSAQSRGNPLPPFLNNLSPNVQDSLIKQINNRPKFIPPGLQQQEEPKITARIDEGSATEVKTGPITSVQKTPLNTANTNPIRRVSRGPVYKRHINSAEKAATRPIPYSATAREPLPLRATAREPVPLVTSANTDSPPRPPPSLLTSLPPKVLEKLRQQLRASQNQKALDSLNNASPVISQPTVDRFQPRDRSSYAHVPQESYVHVPHNSHESVPLQPHHPVQHHHGSDNYYEYEETNPLFDIFLLADANVVHKYGEDNYSLRAPKIGDSSYFVNTRSHYSYYH